MSKYFIEDVHCDFTSGEMTPMGPMFGRAVSAVKCRINDKESKWITEAEVEGYPNFYVTDKDIVDVLIKEPEDDEQEEYIEKAYISEFEGVPVDDYEDMLDVIEKDDKNPDAKLILLLTALCKYSCEDTDELVANAKGKDLDDIPMSFEEFDKRLP